MQTQAIGDPGSRTSGPTWARIDGPVAVATSVDRERSNPMPEQSDESPGKDDGGVLSPDELDISDEENVVELEEGRYVISPGGREPKVPDPFEETQPAPGSTEAEADASPELTEEDVHDWIEARLESADSKYAFDVTASFEGRIGQKALFSNDVVTTFENLVVWYATHAGSDTPVEDVLGILLVESNLSVRFPAESLLSFAEAHGLDVDDSIETLLEVARESGGVRFSAGDG